MKIFANKNDFLHHSIYSEIKLSTIDNLLVEARRLVVKLDSNIIMK